MVTTTPYWTTQYLTALPTVRSTITILNPVNHQPVTVLVLSAGWAAGIMRQGTRLARLQVQKVS